MATNPNDNNVVDFFNRGPVKANKYTKDKLIALGGVTMGIALASVAFGGKPKAEVGPYTDNVNHVVTTGDTLTGIGQDLINESREHPDPRGEIKLNSDGVASYLHTEYNPAAGTRQDPNDGYLQPGERVVGDVPLDTTKVAPEKQP